MGHDDYDDMPPPDEEGEDFRNFDPESYLRRRGGATGVSPSDAERGDQDPSDFDNFDPDAYLRKRRAERGSREYGSASYPPEAEAPLRGRRRRSSVADDDEPLPGIGDAAGLGAGFLSLFRPGEGVGLKLEILREASPLIKGALLALGCAIVVVLGSICALGFLLANALARR